MGVVLNIEVAVEEMQQVETVFRCACGSPAAKKVCSAGVDEGKEFYRCANGYVENTASGKYEDPASPRHLGCNTWVLVEVIDRFARAVYDDNQLSDAYLRASLLGITTPRLIGYNGLHEAGIKNEGGSSSEQGQAN